MKINRVQIFSYRLPFREPISFLSSQVTVREGMVLCITDKSGLCGYGECAPLPGYSRETMDKAKSELITVARRLRNLEIAELNPLEIATTLCDDSAASSVRFAVESALVSLAASEIDGPVASILAHDFALQVSVNALIESPKKLTSRLAELTAHNCRAVKLKVGRQTLANDIETVTLVRNSLPLEIALRLDANRAWTLDKADQFAQGIHQCAIEYIEEPLRDSAELPLLHDNAPDLPLAIDESVKDMDIEYIREAGHFCAVIIKPTVVGGIARSLDIVRACRQSEKKAVLGATIESSLGLLMIAHMAASLIQDTPVGLDTSRLFSRDLISPPLRIVDYSIEIDQHGSSAYTLNQDVLEEVLCG